MLVVFVGSVRRIEVKILRAIVVPDVIQMVDNLLRLKVAPKRLLHHEAVLTDISVPISAGVIASKHKDVALIVRITTALPTPVVRTRLAPSQEHSQHPITLRPTHHRASRVLGTGRGPVKRARANRASSIRATVRSLLHGYLLVVHPNTTTSAIPVASGSPILVSARP